jgi:beta-lactamase class A
MRKEQSMTMESTAPAKDATLFAADTVPDNLEPDLLADVQAIERESGGKLCFAARDLQTGRTYCYRADEKCKTASVIKFPILVHVALAVQEGSLSWSEKLVLTDAEKVGGSGVLTQLTAGLSLTLRDVCTLMTIVSDNTGTNMVIERVGTAPINARMRALGLPVTTVFRKSYTDDTPESKPYGLGVTTPREMLRLLMLLAEGRLGAPAGEEILKIMAEQYYRDCIPRLLPEDWKYAGKTGSIDPVRNDVGIVTAPDGRRFALALFCQDLPVVLWTSDNPGMLALARLTRRLLLGPQSREEGRGKREE